MLYARRQRAVLSLVFSPPPPSQVFADALTLGLMCYATYLEPDDDEDSDRLELVYAGALSVQVRPPVAPTPPHPPSALAQEQEQEQHFVPARVCVCLSLVCIVDENSRLRPQVG